MRLWMIIPFLGALAVLTVLLLGLQRDDVRTLPSALIGQPVPDFELPGLDPAPGLSASDLKDGGVKLINIWASWCGPCRIEHEQLMTLAAEGVVIHGINYKDKRDNARAFLAELGSPYKRIGRDENGRIGIEFGVYGVPETFVIDGTGKIRYKLVGPILDRNIDDLREAIKRAAAE